MTECLPDVLLTMSQPDIVKSALVYIFNGRLQQNVNQRR